MQSKGQYHALARERTMPWRCDSLRRPCLSRVIFDRSSPSCQPRIGKHNGRSFVPARRPSAANLLRAARDKQPPSSRTVARAAPIARRRLRLPVSLIKMPIVRILLVLLALASPLSMAGGALAGPLEDAEAAHGRRDYATALRLWRPLTDQGNAGAQYALGFMYAGGQGVPKNYAEAAKWWRLAADQGNTFAQYNLGTLGGERSERVGRCCVHRGISPPPRFARTLPIARRRRA
jgi:hypothetical protein